MGNTETSMAFSDEVVGQIAKAVQLAIITGTDVVDNLRMMRVETDDETGLLVLTDEYREIASNQIEKLMEEAEAFQAESE